ncbi:hypothetical protein MOQ_001075 [Trypanosoma cruzi marinkellei]|uniref:Uncharacterized protein n=1 Tax=Trypanosoma cruzi marinkellei TaxID=85056 RepID=K2MTY8_TRYCR|nr:hypothetical protein MOQ_001075 [Trypanosoma cruzi marinkellei]
MFEPLRKERVPSRVQGREGYVAFAVHPDPTSTAFNWGCCTVTSKLDLIFHRARDASTGLSPPGAREKKKTPYFFRLSCESGSVVPEYPIQPANVIDYVFSEGSNVHMGQGEKSAVFAQHMPTVAILLRVSSSEVNLLVLRPVLRGKKGKGVVIRYNTLLLPAPGCARYVRLDRRGGVVFLLGPYVYEYDGRIQCYSLQLDGDKQITSSFRTIHLMTSVSSTGNKFTAASMLVGTQMIVWASLRRPLCHVSDNSHVFFVDLMFLTDRGTAMVFRVSLGDENRGCHATCIWLSHLFQNNFYKNTRIPLGVIERWKTTSFFAHAIDEAKAFEKSLEENTRVELHPVSTDIPIVCESSTGTVVCVIIPSEEKACLIALGSNVKASAMNSCSSVCVATPSNVTICDVAWVAGSLCGFLLLGVSKNLNHLKAMLFFLPLTGHMPLRMHLDRAHASFLTSDGGIFSFFSIERSKDVFGTTQLHLSLYHRLGSHEEGNEDEVRTGLLSLPTVASLGPMCSPSHVMHIIYFTGLASFASMHDRTPITPALEKVESTATGDEGSALRRSSHTFDADNEVQVSVEATLESFFDSWLHTGIEGLAFPLCDVMHEIIPSLIEDMEHSRIASAVSKTGNGGNCAALLSVFRAVADVLAAVSVTSTASMLWRYLAEIHGIVVMLRYVLTVMGQSGAVSTCFTAVAFFTPLVEKNATGELKCPEWCALIAPLFDDAFAHVASCPSLAHALLPYCSASLQRIMSTGESLLRREKKQELKTDVPHVSVYHNGEEVRPLEETLSLARRGNSGLVLLSAADVCWAARRLFFCDGVDAARAFLKTVVDYHLSNPDVRAVCAEYDLVQKELATVVNCI